MCLKPDLKCLGVFQTLQKNVNMLCAPCNVTQQDLQLTTIFVAHLQLVSMLNKVAFNPSVACQSQPGSSGPMRAKQTMPAQLQMDRSCGSVERGQTALVSCLHCSSAACYASRSLSLSLSISCVRRALNGTPRLRGNMEQDLLPSKYCSRSLTYHQIQREHGERYLNPFSTDTMSESHILP